MLTQRPTAARARAALLLGAVLCVLPACRQSECARNSDCKAGHYCRQIDWRCVAECVADSDCPLGAFCAPSCGACVRCDLTCATDPLSGPGGAPPPGACLPVTPPAARCAVAAPVPMCAVRGGLPDAELVVEDAGARVSEPLDAASAADAGDETGSPP